MELFPTIRERSNRVGTFSKVESRLQKYMDAQDEIKLAGDPLQEIRDLGAENLENNVSEKETTRKEQSEPTSSNTEA